MLSSLASPPPAFGLDLADGSVKIVQLRRRGQKVTVDVLSAVPLPPGLIEDGEIRDRPEVTATMQRVLEPFTDTLTKVVVASLPETKTFVETVVVPKEGPAPFADQLARVLPEHLPLPPDEVYHDAVILNETDQRWQALVGAAPKAVVRSYLDLFESLGLIPLALDAQALAISRALIPAGAGQSRAIVDLGRRRASLMWQDRGAIQFTVSLPIAGDEVTKSIAEGLKITIPQAEKAKVTCGLDPVKCEGVLRTVLDGMVVSLVKRITEAREFYQDRFPEARDLEEVILAGGGGHLFSLDRVLSDALKVPVRVGNLWQNVPLATPPPGESPLQYAAAVGLAIRALDGETLA